MREESAPPENELRRYEKLPNPYDHELRFRKSTEKLHVPEWYRDRKITKPSETDISRSTSVSEHGTYTGNTTTAPYVSGKAETSLATRSDGFSRYGSASRYRFSPSSEVSKSEYSPSSDIVLPIGMFDKYKDEINEMRRSRTSLHQIAGDYRKEGDDLRYSSQPTSSFESTGGDKLDNMTHTRSNESRGYTVTSVPVEWGLSPYRDSRVVEVMDTFTPKHLEGGDLRNDNRVTLEEILDVIFREESKSSDRVLHSSGDNATSLYDDSNLDRPSIYTKNTEIMNRITRQPNEAKELLKNERLFVRCTRCHKTKELSEAKTDYVSCKNCYNYYCSRSCRLLDWPQHRDRCTFARINTLCKDVIIKVRHDVEAQRVMSKVAREGHLSKGRGSVNLRLSSADYAQNYITNGWKVFDHMDVNQLLHYNAISSLIRQRKEPSLVTLCDTYDPLEKFILSVSIIADIEQCPQTPPPVSEPLLEAKVTPHVRSPPSTLQQHRENSGDAPRSFPSDSFPTAIPTEV
ncbi:hypothetical protein AB6A40_006657 [Gnathostoma spinigerum]|uniref:MYND-type domain-containing protein n=1 Tax=Gnathostoma spinigerum TaxID=75299 RepID=A0ABD6ESE4_9BILA